MVNRLKSKKKEINLWDKILFDQPYFNRYSFFAGIDEAGRGPLAGPVVSACVVFKNFSPHLAIDDSKKLTSKQREELFFLIKENAFISYSAVDHQTIDRINILNATHLSMNQALEKLPIKVNFALVDGLAVKSLKIEHKAIVKGDAKSFSIAAASIIAKKIRDDIMLKYAKKYPQYQFEKHKGYGTKLHIELIKQFGLSAIHRKSFKLKC